MIVDESIKGYLPISLGEMKDIRLMNRIDTKFVTNLDKLHQLLLLANEDYRIQEIKGERNMEYDTTYFDTRDFDMYYAHANGHANRQKLRFRTYVSSNLQFMEIKTKNNHGRTKKTRIEVNGIDIHEPEVHDYIASHLRYSPENLQPAIRNKFNRITLVNKDKTERLTIDTSLQFFNLITGKKCNMNNLVIVELKRDGRCYSPVLEMLRILHIHPHGFSKYTMGSALTNYKLRCNRIKPKLREVSKIIRY